MPPPSGFNHLPPNSGAGVGSGVEALTGRFHTDGRPIRRKVFTGTLSGTGTATVAHGITSLDDIILMYLAGSNSGGTSHAAAIYDGQINADGTNINITAGATFNDFDYVLVIEYVL